jgi:hypothetical protein
MVSNDVNALHSVFKRHLNAKLSPDPDVVDEFTQFVKNQLKKKKYDIPVNFRFTTWDEYYLSLDPKKRPIYLSGY